MPLQQHIAFCRPLAFSVGIGAHAAIVQRSIGRDEGEGVSGQKRPRSG
jgi:hypothetical protein